jgi:hypothetical protein
MNRPAASLLPAFHNIKNDEIEIPSLDILA